MTMASPMSPDADKMAEVVRAPSEAEPTHRSLGSRGTINTWAGNDSVVLEAEMAAPDPGGETRKFFVIATFPFSDGLATGEIISCPPEFEGLMTSRYPDYTDLATPKPEVKS